MSTIAFIFARGGSKGIKNKNLKNFLGEPLIAHTIKLAKKNKNIQDVYVSTDSTKIKEISMNYGAKIINRPNSLATDTSPEFESWKHAIKCLEKKKIYFRNFLSLPCTAPLRKNQDINNLLNKLNKKTDIVVGVTRARKNPFFNILKFDNAKFLKKISNNNFFRRQDAPKVVDLTTVGYLANKNFIKQNMSIFDGKMQGVFIPEERSIDIDNQFDFKLSEIIKKYYDK